MMSELSPNGWAYTRLDRVAEVVAGNPAPQGSQYFDNGEFNFVRVHDMGVNGNNTFLTETRDLINDTATAKMRLIPANSVLFTKSGASTLLNQRAILAKDSYVVSHIAAAIPLNGVKCKWLFYFLQLVDFATLAHATNMPSIPLSRAKAIIVPIAPTTEQARIVAKTEELLCELEKGIESLKAARAKLDTYRQAVLKHAFEGKLTSQWREENKDKLETPEQLLARIMQEREARYDQQIKRWKANVEEWEDNGRNGKKPIRPRKPKELNSVAKSDSLGVLPSGWRWTEVSEIADLVTDGTHHTPNYTSSGVPFISVKDVRNGRVNLDDCKFITRCEHNVLIQRCHPEPGDLLITKSGTIGRLAIVPDKEFSLFVSVALVKIQSAQAHISSRWLRYAFEHHIMGLNIDQQVKGGLLKNYHLEDLRLARLPLCCVSEQEELVRKVEEKLSVLEDLYTALDQPQVKADMLRQSILQKAFAGQLVQQDPREEPASVLLDRIRTEREETMQINRYKKTKKKRTKV